MPKECFHCGGTLHTSTCPDIPKPDDTYAHLTTEESAYFEAITLAIAHWPKDRKCHRSTGPHHHSGDVCHYAFVFDVYDKLHLKEYGCHAS